MGGFDGLTVVFRSHEKWSTLWNPSYEPSEFHLRSIFSRYCNIPTFILSSFTIHIHSSFFSAAYTEEGICCSVQGICCSRNSQVHLMRLYQTERKSSVSTPLSSVQLSGRLFSARRAAEELCRRRYFKAQGQFHGSSRRGAVVNESD